MEQHLLTSGIEKIILKIYIFLIIAFFILALMNLMGGRPIRLFIYKRRSFLLYTLFRNSFTFCFVCFLGLLIFLISRSTLMTSKIVSEWLLTLFLIFIVIIPIGLYMFITRRGLLQFSRIKKRFFRYINYRAISLRLTILIFIIVFIYLILTNSTIVVQIGSTFIEFAWIILGFLALPALIFNNYILRRNIWNYIIKGIKPKVNTDLIHLYRYCLVINGKDCPGQFSDLMKNSSRRKSHKRVFKISQSTDLLDRLHAYTDYNEDISPLRKIESNNIKDSIDERKDEELSWLLKSSEIFAEYIAAPFRIYLLDSADYELLKSKWKDKNSFNKTLVNRVSSVYLLLGAKTTKNDLDLFIDLLHNNNIIKGIVFIIEKNKKYLFKDYLTHIRGIEIHDLDTYNPRNIIDRILSIEKILFKNRLGNSTAINELVNLEITKAKLSSLDTEYQNGNIDIQLFKQKFIAIVKQHSEEIETRNGSFLDNKNADNYLETIPDSIKYFDFLAAKDLIRLMFNENDYSTRVYIIFNLIEMMTKTLVFACLSNHLPDHYDVRNFPNSLTSTAVGSTGITDFADDINYLKRFINECNNDKNRLSHSHSLLISYLTNKIDFSIIEHLEQLRIFYPYIYDIKIYNIIELFDFSSFLRNQIRGHGVVTNFVATIVYPILLNLFEIICRTVDDFKLNLKKIDNDSVKININEISIPAGKFIRYNTELDDFIFLGGYRHNLPVYISYTGGKKYKPAVLTGLN